MNTLDRLWHRLLGHVITFLPANTPDFRLDDGTGVHFVGENMFVRNDAHYVCSCGTTWSAHPSVGFGPWS